MTQHKWVLENIAAYLAGGLSHEERTQLARHVEECEPCTQALEQVRALDEGLTALFAPARPQPELETRMIQALRTAPGRPASPITKFVHMRIRFRMIAAAAAVFMLAVLGAGINFLGEEGVLPFPGQPFKGGKTSAYIWREGEESSGETALSHMLFSARGEAQRNGKPTGLRPLHGELRGQWETSVDEGRDLLTGERVIDTPPEFQILRGAAGGSKPREGFEAMRGNSLAQSMSDNTISSPAEMGLNMKSQAMAGQGEKEKTRINVDFTKESQRFGVTSSKLRDPAASITLSQSATNGKQIFAGTTIAGAGMAPGTEVTTITAPALPAVATPSPAPDTGKDQKIARAHNERGGMDSKELAKIQADVTKKTEKLAAKLAGKDPPSQVAVQDGLPDQKPAEPKAPDKAEPEPKSAPKADPVALAQRKIIRSGSIDFEVESFDSADEKVRKIAAEEKAFVSGVERQSEPNGKVKGTIVVRCPPERLDTLILKLRALGDLKGQSVKSEDITEQFTDIESEFKAAQAMEESFLGIIKSGKGTVKEISDAQERLGEWRTKRIKFENKIRICNDQIALSTLKIMLVEKEIRTAYGITEAETVAMSLETDDVDKTYRDAQATITENKGRITKATLERHPKGDQQHGHIECEVAPEAAGALRDALKKLGTSTRFGISLSQKAEGGVLRPNDAKARRKGVEFTIDIDNLASIEPRETIHLKLACQDAEEVHRKVKALAEKANAQGITAPINRQGPELSTANIKFRVKPSEADALLLDLKPLGEVLRLQITENTDMQNSFRTVKGFNIDLVGFGTVAARETIQVQLATREVRAAFEKVKKAAREASGRVLNPNLDEQDKQNMKATFDIEAPRDKRAEIEEALRVGDIYTRNSVAAPESENTVDSKVLWKVTITSQLIPRETYVLGIEVSDPHKVNAELVKLAKEMKGWSLEPIESQDGTGKVTMQTAFEVPLKSVSRLVDKAKASGRVRASNMKPNRQVPESDLAVAHVVVTLSNDVLLPADEGLWSNVRSGLYYSLRAIGWSLTWLIVGVLVVLPWAILIWGIWKLTTRGRKPLQTPEAPPAA